MSSVIERTYARRTRMTLGLVLAACLAPVAAGCATDVDDADAVDSADDLGDTEVSTTTQGITLPVGNHGCGSLYRTSSSSQNAYLYGCGNKFFGALYRVPFNGFNVYYCFTSARARLVGAQADLAASNAPLMGTPVAYDWCNTAYPSVHYSGG